MKKGELYMNELPTEFDVEKKSAKKAVPLTLWLSLVIFAAAISSAYILGNSIYGGLTANDRVIEVRGRADQNVDAVSASIRIDITFAGDNVADVKKELEDVSKDVYGYIQKEILAGDVNKGSIEESDVELFDRKTDYEKIYKDGKEIETKIDRYSAEKSIKLLNIDVKSAKNIKTKIEFDFVSNGYSTYTSINLSYGYPSVNDIKPELLKESLINARMAAEQFAKDSGQKIGPIKTARQGTVELSEHGEYETASIVSTVTFYLK